MFDHTGIFWIFYDIIMCINGRFSDNTRRLSATTGGSIKLL